MSKVKEKALEAIIEEASDLFLKNGVSAVTMEDIAKASEIGVASVYRYFGSKQNIVVKSAVMLADKVFKEYFISRSDLNGLDQMTSFYMSFFRIFRENKNYYRFVKELDALYLTDAGESKAEYENEIDLFYKKYVEIYEKGIKDKSISKVKDIRTFYYSTTHSLLNLCKDLSRDKVRVFQDSSTLAEDEILALIDIIIYRLSN